MDEEDGRPGDVALQSGHRNALSGVCGVSSRRADPAKSSNPIRAFLRKISVLPRTHLSAQNISAPSGQACNFKEKSHENLPGK
jgi:hypothetical protein